MSGPRPAAVKLPPRNQLHRATCTECGCVFYVEDRWIGYAREQSYTGALMCPIGCNLGDEEAGTSLSLEALT